MPVAIDEMEVESAPAPNQSSAPTPRASKTRPAGNRTRLAHSPRTRRTGARALRQNDGRLD